MLSLIERINLLIKLIEVNGCANSSKPFIAVNTAAIPKMSIPILRTFLLLKKMRKAPVIANGTRILSKLNVIHSVLNVVPIFVPKIIPIDWGNVMILAEIRPIVMTMTAVLLCKRAVINVPVNIPFNGVLVSFISQSLNLSADKLNNPILIIVIPKINKRINKINNSMYSMSFSPSFIHCMVREKRTCQFLGKYIQKDAAKKKIKKLV
jgi:hypothetical protein